MVGMFLGLAHCAAAQLDPHLLWLAGGHAGSVVAVAWSPDGALLATASDDATVKLWSTNGLLLKSLATHPYQATALAFSPEGTRLAVGTYAGGYYFASNGLGRVLLWQATNGWTGSNVTLVRTLTNHCGQITAVAFSPGGTNLAAGNAAGSNIVRRLSDGAIVAQFAAYKTFGTNPAPIHSLAFSVTGLLASGCADGTIRVYNPAWSLVWSNTTAHSSNVTAVAFLPNGSGLATASLDGAIRLWSTTNWAAMGTLSGHSGGVTTLAISPDGTTVASGGADGMLRLWNLPSMTCTATLAAHAEAVSSLVFSPDGTRLASAGRDKTVKVWSVAGGTPLAQFGAHTDYIKTVAVSPDGTLCASVSNDKTIQVRRLTDGALLRTLAGHTGCVSAIAFAPDSAVLASGGGPLDPTIKLWQLHDGALLRAIPASSNGVMALAFSPDGSMLASGGDSEEQTIRLWEVASGTLQRTLSGHANGVTCLAFSSRGDLLVSGGRRSGSGTRDSTVKVWAVTNDTLVRAFATYSNNTESVAFAPDGDTVAVGSSASGVANSGATNLLTLWKVSDGSSRNLGAETNPVFFVAFSADGSVLASASKDAIKLWQATTGTLIRAITQETFRVSCLAYSPNANLFVYGREDATLVASANPVGALGQPPLEFVNIAAGVQGFATLEARGQPLTRYVIEATTNFADWAFVTLARSESERLQVILSTTNRPPAQFYRAITPP